MAKDYFQSKEFDDILNSYEQQKEQGHGIYLDADDFADIADFYLGHELPDLAMEAVNNGLAVHPEDEVLLVVKSATFIYQHEFEEAEKVLSTMDKNNLDVMYQMAQLQYGYYFNTPKAESIWREWLDGMEDDNELMEAKREGYLHIISSLIELRGDASNPSDRKWNADTVRKWVREYIERFKPLGTSDEDIQLVDICRENDLLDVMCEALAAVLEVQPYLPKGWSNLALAYYMEEKNEQALEACDFALAVNADDIDALLTKAHTLHAMKHKKECIPVFEEYLEKGGEGVQCLPLADALFSTGRREEALFKLDELARKTEDERIEMEGRLKHDESHLPEEDMKAKRSFYDNFFDLYERIFTDIGDICHRNKCYEESIKAFKHVLEVNPHSSGGHFMMGINHLSQNNYKEASDDFGNALLYASDQVMMGIDIALTFVLNNYDDFALEVLNAIEKLSKLSTSPYAKNIPAAKSLVFLRLGHTDQFMRYFRVACKMTPDLMEKVYEGCFPEGMPLEQWPDYAQREILTLLENFNSQKKKRLSAF